MGVVNTVVSLRSPDHVMRLSRMGSFHPTRLSFSRSLIRLLNRKSSSISCSEWSIDAEAQGHAVYTAKLRGHVLSLCCFSHPIAPEQRTDRVIAEAWDASFVLFNGVPTDADIDRLGRNAPLQEAGRFTSSDLVLSRANRSERLFQHVLAALCMGKQPSEQPIIDIGYLMRTTAVYGNGKFGLSDRSAIVACDELLEPFRLEMLAVYLIRCFTLDLVNHLAKKTGGVAATRLAPKLARHIGIGNSTGLGMAPFLVNHPELLHNWFWAREAALAEVLAITEVDHRKLYRCQRLLDRVRRHLGQWNVQDQTAMQNIRSLRASVSHVQSLCDHPLLEHPMPWRALFEAAEACSEECAELMVSVLLEIHQSAVDRFANGLSTNEYSRVRPDESLAVLEASIRRDWAWALAIDCNDPQQRHWFWYVSEEKLEPRLGERAREPGAARELPFDFPRQVQTLLQDILQYVEKYQDYEDALNCAEFLSEFSWHRMLIERIQGLRQHPYGEIRDNLVAKSCRPIDMLRCKLSFFGASKFDPRSDRWTRIVLFQGAPLIDELHEVDADDWAFPALSRSSEKVSCD